MHRDEPSLRALRWLASMPFLDRLELAAVSGAPDRTAYDAVAGLERRGLAGSLRHATDLIASTRRLYPTAAGLRLLAREDGTTADDLLLRYPVSARWRRILLERLDAVAVIYRLAAAVAAERGPIGFRWYRAMPIDAAIVLPGGRTVGVVRQGLTSDRTGFAKRLWRLREGPRPGAVLLLLPDEIRLRQARALLSGARVPAFLALERDAARCSPDEPVWHPPSIAATLNLRDVLSLVDKGGALPAEPAPLRAEFPGDIATSGPGQPVPDHLLPALLRPAEKRALDLLSDWPWITAKDLAGLLGVSGRRTSQLVTALEGWDLVTAVSAAGRRLALTDRGLALLARRDRTSVGAARKRWGVTPADPDTPVAWRGVPGRRSRQLLRNLEHTAAVHEFIAALASQAHSLGWEVVQLDPPSRAARHFRHEGRLRSVHPDAFGMLRRGVASWPFFLEWERRAVRPVTMAARLAPYLRYFSSSEPIDDHGAQPTLLVVFDDEIAATHFRRVAQEEMDAIEVIVPLQVVSQSTVERVGPKGSLA